MEFEEGALNRDPANFGNLPISENNPNLQKLIFNITHTVFTFSKEIAYYPVLHPDLIASGLAWQALQHVFFDLVDDKKRGEMFLKEIVKESAQTLKQLASFAVKFKSQGSESF